MGLTNNKKKNQDSTPNYKTSPQGVGRRYAHVVLRKADIDLTKRAGELTEDEVRTRKGVLWAGPALEGRPSVSDLCPA